MAEESSGLDSVLKGLLGFTGGVLQRHRLGNVLMSGLRGGVLGSRSGETAPAEGGDLSAYLGALTGLPADKGWAAAAAPAPTGAGNGMDNPAMEAWLPSFMKNPMLMQAGMDAMQAQPKNPFGSARVSPFEAGGAFAKPVAPLADPLAMLKDPEVLRKMGWLKPG
jgi:hypothetical protein